MIIGIFFTAIWNIVDPEGVSDQGDAGRILGGMILINLMFEMQYRKLKQSLDED